MSIFSDDRSLGYHRHAAKTQIGLWLFGLGTTALLILALLPAPFVIQVPGPAYDTLGNIVIDEADVPMISVPSAETYPTEGELNLLTVSTRGNPQSNPVWFEVVLGWLDPTRRVVPMEAAYPSGITVDEVQEQNALLMQSSQQSAIAAAFTELGIDYSTVLTVAAVSEDLPAFEILQEGDRIVNVNGEPVTSVTQLQQAITDNGTEVPAQLRIRREGKASTVEVTPVEQNGSVVVGIQVGAQFDFPIQVVIQLENVGGPSGGLMFALGVVDKLTPGALTGGNIIAGTGTIDSGGEVGPIGGIQQKLVSAQREGATYFLAPLENCGEVVGNVPGGLQVIAVSTLSEARDALERIRHNVAPQDLPTCG